MWLGRCCLCGDVKLIKHCSWCGHDFCDACRYSGERVVAAVKTAVGRSRLFCGGTKHG